MDSVLQDLRYALRTLSRAPAFTIAAALALALGVAGSSAMFSVLESVVLRPLAAPHPDELVRLYEVSPGGDKGPWSPADYLDLASQNSSFSSVSAVRFGSVSLTTDGGPVALQAARVPASFFATLGVHPALGRGFAAEEDREGAPLTAILTEALWKREFNGDRQILGKKVVLNGRSTEIVGIMPASFRFPLLRGSELLLPMEMTKEAMAARGMHGWPAFGRLKPGVTVARAQADLDVVGARISALIPEHAGQTFRAVPLLEDLVGKVKPVLQALLGAVAMVLLIACANVASMLLARGAARQRELAIRAALGSGRGRIVRQLLTETMLLALLGGALGVVLAAWGVDGLVALAPKNLPRLEEVRLDGTVLAFALFASVASGLIAGLVPALQASRPDVLEALKNGAAAVTSRNRARSVLVVAEVALALVLVVGAGLMIRTVGRLLEVHTGMNADPAHVLIADIALPKANYPNDEAVEAFERQIVERAKALPGVQSAALTSMMPLVSTNVWQLSFLIEGEPTPPANQQPDAYVAPVTSGFLETLGIPLIQGRNFTAADSAKAPLVVLVNQAFVKKHLKGGEAVGRRIRSLRNDNDERTIVGVVGDVRGRSLDTEAEPQIYAARPQWEDIYSRLLVRTAGDPMALVPSLRAELRQLDKDRPLDRPRTLETVIGDSVGERRFQMLLLSLFGAIALLLAAIGIYGLIAYSVTQRSKEIGIRMALGAPAQSVLGMVVGSGLRLAAMGVGAGLVGALFVTRALEKALYGVSAFDPLTLGGVSLLLLLIAAVASWAPARRAAKVDPAISLRAE